MEDDACDDPCETAVLQGQHGWAGRSAGRHGRHIRLHIQVPAQGQRLRGRACASYRPEGARAIEERVRGAQEEVSSRQSHPCIYPPHPIRTRHMLHMLHITLRESIYDPGCIIYLSLIKIQ